MDVMHLVLLKLAGNAILQLYILSLCAVLSVEMASLNHQIQNYVMMEIETTMMVAQVLAK